MDMPEKDLSNFVWHLYQNITGASKNCMTKDTMTGKRNGLSEEFRFFGYLSKGVIKVWLGALVLFVMIIYPACSPPSCTTLPTAFESWEEAVIAVEQADYAKTDSFVSDESSWIKGASFYSCDGKSGYLVLDTYRGDYLHKGVPSDLWEDFKKAESQGVFYNVNLKGRFRFYLDGE
jgi:hypothetical protein